MPKARPDASVSTTTGMGLGPRPTGAGIAFGTRPRMRTDPFISTLPSLAGLRTSSQYNQSMNRPTLTIRKGRAATLGKRNQPECYGLTREPNPTPSLPGERNASRHSNTQDAQPDHGQHQEQRHQTGNSHPVGTAPEGLPLPAPLQETSGKTGFCSASLPRRGFRTWMLLAWPRL